MWPGPGHLNKEVGCIAFDEILWYTVSVSVCKSLDVWTDTRSELAVTMLAVTLLLSLLCTLPGVILVFVASVFFFVL